MLRLHNPSFIIHHLASSVRQHTGYTASVAIGNVSVNVQVAFPFGGLFGQNVAGMAVTAFDFAGRGSAKTLRCALMCFKFRHNSYSPMLIANIWAVGPKGDYTLNGAKVRPAKAFRANFTSQPALSLLPSAARVSAWPLLSALARLPLPQTRLPLARRRQVSAWVRLSRQLFGVSGR